MAYWFYGVSISLKKWYAQYMAKYETLTLFYHRALRTCAMVTLLSLLISCANRGDLQNREAHAYRGDMYWTLEFTWLKNDQPVHVKTYSFDTRDECFNAMYQMQKEAKRIKNESGAGLCFKKFAEGQVRTSADELTVR